MLIEVQKEPGYEKILYCHDGESGLEAYIAVHSTVLGPSLGGARLWSYKDCTNPKEAARTDVLRLSRGMTHKASMAGLNLGGGKAVLIGDETEWDERKREQIFLAFGDFVDLLGGQYITAEDVGTSSEDMIIIRKGTNYVTGLPTWKGGSGDPSPVTARGVYKGMQACAKEHLGNGHLNGLTVAIQGIGHVGTPLVDLVYNDLAGNVKLILSDLKFDDDKRPEMVEMYKRKYNATIVPSKEIYQQECDIFSPCALGAILNDTTIPQLQCRIVAGSANNQLADDTRHDVMLKERGILYAPDFVINAGGLINVMDEREAGGYNRERVLNRILNLKNTLRAIFQLSRVKHAPMSRVADELAEDIFNGKRSNGVV